MTGVPLGNIFTTSIFKKKKKRARLGYYQKLERNYPFEMNRTFLSFYTNQLIIDGNENPWNKRITQTYRDRWHKGQIIIFLDRECWKIFTCKHFFFICIQFVSVFTASANNLFQNFPPPPPPPRPKKNGPSLLRWNWSILEYDVRFVPVRNCK